MDDTTNRSGRRQSVLNNIITHSLLGLILITVYICQQCLFTRCNQVGLNVVNNQLTLSETDRGLVYIEKEFHLNRL